MSHKVNILVITEIPKLAFFTANSTWNLFHLACPALDHPGDEQGGEDVDGGGEESRDDAGGEEGQKGTACSLEKTRPEKKNCIFVCIYILPPKHRRIHTLIHQDLRVQPRYLRSETLLRENV